MRLNSHGKWSCSVIAGALGIISFFLLYQLWTLTATNSDLSRRIHTFEQQIVLLTRNNVEVKSSLSKTLEDKSRLQSSLLAEQMQEKQVSYRLEQKESSVKDLQNDLENAKQESQNCKEELGKMEPKLQSKESDVLELKEKVLKLQNELDSEKEKFKDLMKPSKAVQQNEGGSGSALKPGAAGTNEQHIQGKDPGNAEGALPAFINFQEDQMKPMDEQEPVEQNPKPPSLKTGEAQNGNGEPNNGGEIGEPKEKGNGVPKIQHNLDAEEDDQIHPLKDDGRANDDQSPDGMLSQAEIKASGHENQNPGQYPLPQPEHAHDGGGGGLDGREEAHQADPALNNL